MKKYLLTYIMFFMNTNLYSNDLVYANLEYYPHKIKNNTYLFAIKLNIQENWHIYWKNPGDAGFPTQIKISSPKNNINFSEIIFPPPEIFYSSGLLSYGYKNEVIFPFLVEVDKLEDLIFNIHIYGLACNEVCEEFDINIDFNFSKNTYKQDNELIDFYKKLPKFDKNIILNYDDNDDYLIIKFKNIPFSNIVSAYFFPEIQNQFLNEKIQKYEIKDNYIAIFLRKNPLNSSNLYTFKGILKITTENNIIYYNITN